MTDETEQAMCARVACGHPVGAHYLTFDGTRSGCVQCECPGAARLESITHRPRGGRASNVTPERATQMRALRAEGLTLTEIARRLGVSRPTVANHVREVRP